MKAVYCLFVAALLLTFTGCTKSSTTPTGTTTGGTTTGGGVTQAPPTPPAAPVAKTVNASTITSTGFTALWQKVATADKYQVYVATDNLFVHPVTGYNPATVTDTSLAVGNLSAGTNYYYRVLSSANGLTSTNYSNVIGVTTSKSWQLVGSQGFSAGSVVYNTALAIDNSNIPYIAFQDAGNNNAATVMKFNGSSWVLVGKAGFSTANITTISIYIDKASNTPYVLYGDAFGYATVQKFTGSNWSVVGNIQFVDLGSESSAIITDASGTPYVAVADFGIGHKGQASVMKFTGSVWVYVGSAAFSIAYPISYISMAMDVSGTPYVAYDDGHGSSVEKFNGTKWVDVGQERFNGTTSGFTTIAFDNNNIPYVVSSTDVGYSSPACYRYNGSYWAQVGSTIIGLNYYPAFAINSSGTPYIAFQQNTSAFHSATVMKYDGSNWLAAGNTSFTNGYINSPPNSNNIIRSLSIAIDKNGVVYVAYADDNANAKASVMKLTP